MIKYLSVIVIMCSSLCLAQSKKGVQSSESEVTVSTAETAEVALNAYIELREGYKRSGTKQFSRTEQFEMDDWCFDMQEKFPDAWQTDFAWYLNGHFYQERGDKILSAYKKAPSDKRVVKSLYGYYGMKGEYGKQKELASKVIKYYSTNVLSYYEDVFPATGVLIVSSEEEAIPLYALQQVKGKGKGVTVVNMDYLINDEYRKAMAHKLGTGSAKFFGEEKTFIKTSLASRNVHLSATVPQAYLSSAADNTFLTGLYYEGYVKDQQDKLNTFWVSVATKNFASMSLTSSEKRLYRNYLPPLLTLYKLKKTLGESEETLRKAIVVIAKKVEQTKTVNEILTAYDNG